MRADACSPAAEFKFCQEHATHCPSFVNPLCALKLPAVRGCWSYSWVSLRKFSGLCEEGVFDGSYGDTVGF